MSRTDLNFVSRDFELGVRIDLRCGFVRVESIEAPVASLIVFSNFNPSTPRLLVIKEGNVASGIVAKKVRCRSRIHPLKSCFLESFFLFLRLLSLFDTVDKMWQKCCEILELVRLLLIKRSPIAPVSVVLCDKDELNLPLADILQDHILDYVIQLKQRISGII